MKKKTTFVLLTNCSTFSQCVHCLLLQQHKQRWKPEADESSVRQDLHHSSVVGDHIHNSFMFVVFMHFSLYYWICIDFVICYRLLSLFILTIPQMYSAINNIAWFILLSYFKASGILTYCRHNSECNNVYEASIGRATLTHTLPELLISSQFCAGSQTGTIALGDSGGPSILRYVIISSK